jgi:hypothetical protein
MQWIPVSRELLDALPSDRPFTKLEAAVKLTADLQDGISRSMRENGRILGWDHKTVKSFIESGLLVRLGNSPDESNDNNVLKDNIPQDLAKISDSPNAPHSFPKCSPYKHNNNVLLQDAIPQTLPTHSPNSPQLYSRESLDKEKTCPSSHSKTLFDLWNEVVAGTSLSSVREFSSTRQKKCTARLRERPLDEWAALFRRIVATPFLCGLNDRGWKADFDWIIANDGNSAKVIEGKYDRTTSTSRPSDSRYSEIFAGA